MRSSTCCLPRSGPPPLLSTQPAPAAHVQLCRQPVLDAAAAPVPPSCRSDAAAASQRVRPPTAAGAAWGGRPLVLRRQVSGSCLGARPEGVDGGRGRGLCWRRPRRDDVPEPHPGRRRRRGPRRQQRPRKLHPHAQPRLGRCRPRARGRRRRLLLLLLLRRRQRLRRRAAAARALGRHLARACGACKLVLPRRHLRRGPLLDRLGLEPAQRWGAAAATQCGHLSQQGSQGDTG